MKTLDKPKDYLFFRKGGRIGATFNLNIMMHVDEFGNEYYEYTSVDVFPLSYDNIVSTIMNTLYPSDKVQALTANYNEARDDEELSEEKRKEYIDEYHAFQAKRKEIKALAREIMQEVTHGQV